MSARGYIVTATDTGVGKTVFSAALTHALDASYWKPVQAGTDAPTDRETVAALSGLAGTRLLAEAYRLRMPASPHIAAAAEGITIDPERLKRLPEAGMLVIEGAGGVLVPITNEMLQIELFAAWGLPVIVCTRTALGTINHTLLTLEALDRRGIACAGIAFIGEGNPPVEATIAGLSGKARLGRLGVVAPLTKEGLQAAFSAGFDVARLKAGSSGQ